MRGQEEISAVITVTDSHGASFEETFTFTIPDENAPTDSVLRLIGDYEIEPVGHKVALGIFKGVNSDGSRMTYSLASESTIGFSIGFHGDNVLYFDATNSKLRGHDELTAIIIATDEQGATYSETITFTVPEPPEDNRAPTDIWFWAWGDYKAHTIEPVENRVTLGTIRSTDPDGDTITYSLGSASHSGFSILTDRRTTELNFQGTAEELRGLDEVSAIVIATDQFGATYSETITFVIPDNKVSPDIVFAPNITFFSVPAFEVPRGGTFVLGYFKGVGGGKSHDDFTYSLGEESHPRFSLRQYENEVGLRFESRLNEWRNDDEVHAVIIATDAEGISYEKTLTFTIPENNAPYNIKLTIPRAYYDDYEAAQIGDTITLGRIQAWDGEQDRLRFSFESGSTPGFSVEYYSPPMLKFDVTEAKRLGLDEITAIITATDIDGASFTKTFTFATHPRAENNAPSDIIFTPFTDYEINPEGRPVTDGSSGEYLGLLEGIDADNGILVYSLSSESTPGFRVSNSGIAFRDDYVAYELTFKATKESLQGLDQATAVVIVTDEYGASYEKTLTFTIPVNDAPTDITFTAATDSTDSFIGTLTTADVDLGDTHTYTLDRASVDAGFSIQGDRVHYTGPATPTVSSVTVTTTDFEGLSYTEIFADIL